MSFNLITEDWIPVIGANGRFGRVGIRRALAEAGNIRQIAASNPMDNVALLRFLLAVLMWCKPELSENDRVQLDGATGIPEDWLNRKLGTADEPNESFNLLGDGKRFFQDNSTEANARPIGDLIVEFPTETKIAHFRHVLDKEYGLCPACCGLGIIRFCAFANAYGGGRYTSAVNGPTPAYAIAHGATLQDTLRLHWPVPNASAGAAPWERTAAPTAEKLDIVTAFAWRSRKFWLSDPSWPGICAYCSESTALIQQLAFTGNWKPPFETTGTQKKFWDQDPHLILVDKSQATEADETSNDNSIEETTSSTKGAIKKPPQKTTLGFPSPGARVTGHTRFWRRVLIAIVSTHPGEGAKPLIMTVAGPAANKGLYQDAASVQLEAHPNHAAFLEAQKQVTKATSSILRRSTPNPDRQHPNRTAALDAISASLEHELRRDFEACSSADDSDSMKKKLSDRLSPIIEQVVRSTTPGSPLRRREAMARARSALDRALDKATAAPNTAPQEQGASSADIAKAPKHKRSRKKKGDSA